MGARDPAQLCPDVDRPIALFDDGGHAVYWLGVPEETAFRCNTYLVLDEGQGVLIDPGNRAYFGQVRSRVAQVLDPGQVRAMVLCHQDPDVSASIVDWLDLNPQIEVISTPRTHVMLPNYGRSGYRSFEAGDRATYRLPSGHVLRFFEAPFLHFPGAFATYDAASQMLFSGDVWAALDLSWSLMVEDFAEHVTALDLFHVDYMASNVASRGFAKKLNGLSIEAILPQHGSIIPRRHVPDALAYLRDLRCGLDIVYADLD